LKIAPSNDILLYVPYRKRTLKLAAKLGLAGGVVYLTVREGIWSDSSSGSNALKDIVNKSDVSTYFSQYH